MTIHTTLYVTMVCGGGDFRNGIIQRILRHGRESEGLLMIISDNIWSSGDHRGAEGRRGEDEAKTKLIY